MASKDESSQELASDRTDLAEDRTLLANERTYASWMRTGMASIAVALGFRALLRDFQPEWLAKSVATAFVLIGAAVIWFAYRRASRIAQRLQSHEVTSLPISRMSWLSLSLVAAALALCVVLWMV
ncbi:YidH family protein [Lysobacter korlensis]|uniref:YidH family protein n=1 Tax=Lysobacter korlensis TaxID=553636 RepID=A0ABV6RLF7_9GAMM